MLPAQDWNVAPPSLTTPKPDNGVAPVTPEPMQTHGAPSISEATNIAAA
jgi:hypothetical protein